MSYQSLLRHTDSTDSLPDREEEKLDTSASSAYASRSTRLSTPNDVEPRSQSTSSNIWLWISASLNVLLLVVVAWGIHHSVKIQTNNACNGAVPTWNPADEAIAYHSVKFTSDEVTKWSGPPSPEVDAAWDDLYNMGLSYLPKAQAALLPTRTLPYPGDEDKYIVSMDVFHELHCLNYLRKKAYPEYYPDVHGHAQRRDQNSDGPHRNHHEGNATRPSSSYDHVDHCINTLRQSLMCSADTTLNVWQWEADANRQGGGYARFRNDNVHTCRDFGKLQAWAAEHSTPLFFDRSVHVVDDLHWADDR